MEFLLTYEGPLKTKGSKKELKWNIRMQFHNQIRKLWDQVPLSDIKKYKDPNYKPNNLYLGRTVNDIEFISIVSEKISTRAKISITLLSSIVNSENHTYFEGDIDNRVKILLDSLRAPQSSQEITDHKKLINEEPIYCLLDDDKLVIGISTTTYPYLNSNDDNSNVLAIIKVKIVASRGLLANIGITG